MCEKGAVLCQIKSSREVLNMCMRGCVVVIIHKVCACMSTSAVRCYRLDARGYQTLLHLQLTAPSMCAWVALRQPGVKASPDNNLQRFSSLSDVQQLKPTSLPVSSHAWWPCSRKEHRMSKVLNVDIIAECWKENLQLHGWKDGSVQPVVWGLLFWRLGCKAQYHLTTGTTDQIKVLSVDHFRQCVGQQHSSYVTCFT